MLECGVSNLGGLGNGGWRILHSFRSVCPKKKSSKPSIRSGSLASLVGIGPNPRRIGIYPTAGVKTRVFVLENLSMLADPGAKDANEPFHEIPYIHNREGIDLS